MQCAKFKSNVNFGEGITYGYINAACIISKNQCRFEYHTVCLYYLDYILSKFYIQKKLATLLDY